MRRKHKAVQNRVCKSQPNEFASGFVPKVVVSKFGEIDGEKINSFVNIMKRCYKRLKQHKVELVDLYVFERSSRAEAFLSKESAAVGVTSEYFGDLFFATHDAWRGTPRIILCLDKIMKLPKPVMVGGIQHEVGHSVLHGSLSYYFLPYPPVLRDLASRFGLSSKYMTNILYLTSIAVKDYEVSRLLKKTFPKEQMAYIRNLLTLSEDDLSSWRMSKGKPLLEIMCLISCLKPASCAAPFLSDKKFGKEIRSRLVANLAYFPKEYSSTLFDILEGFPSLGKDTVRNINVVSRLITERLFEPILKGRLFSHQI